MSKNETIKYLNNNRIDYSKISGTLPLPNLVEIQTESFKWFITQGIKEVLEDVFPIANYSETLQIEYVDCRFDQPKYDYLECKERDMTYSAPLRVTLRLRFKETGEIKESEVFMGDFPLMTKSGTFIINGAERVIVSQLVRSPGAYMSKTMDKSGKYLYEGDLIPTRGTWLQFESDQKDVLSVRIDRQRKMYATILLKALGLENDAEIEELFGVRDNLHGTLEKDAEINTAQKALYEIFRKLKPGEPVTEEGSANFLVQKFFDHKRYDLGRAGRYKYAEKLGIYNRLVDRVLAEPLVSADGEIVYPEGTLLTKEMVEELRDAKFFEQGAHVRHVSINTNLDSHDIVNFIHVYADEKRTIISPVVGTDLNLTEPCVTIPDILAVFSYFMNIMDGFGATDDIDHLGNRRVRCVGELIENQFRIGLSKMGKAVREKMSIADLENVTPQSLVNIRPLTAAIKEFFATSQLSQFMDQTNPLAELTNKRRLSALGPGGLTRDRATFDVRDVHYSHYGRICPIETPEGQNIGLINNLASYAKVNRYGFIETPYRIVDKETCRVLDKAVYLSADDERGHIIAQANVNLGENGEILDDHVISRFDGENVIADKDQIDFIDVSPKQIVSIAASCIPFLENDDTTRALMGANMQRQALPLLRPHAPFVGTGMEHVIARDSGSAVVAEEDGVVKYVDSKRIVVITKDGGEHEYRLQKFGRSNQGTCMNQKPIVKVGQEIHTNDVIADGPAMDNGDLALGQNVTIAFMTWNGYNYEDAVIMSERLVKDDVYTTIHIEEYDLECRDTKLGVEEITRDVPNINEDAKAFLDERGIIIPGAEVKEGDILVGKVTPKGQTEPTPEEKLLMAIFAEKTKDGKDSSLRVPHGGAGIVLDVKTFSRKNGDELAPGVNEVVRVYIVQKRKISEGDKMSGRHGNKGVISRILPVEDMPFLPDGTPIDIMLNPLGVPSRMNIGQILEIHLGMACKKLGLKIATPVFDGMSNDEIFDLMAKAGMEKDGKTILYDGRTGDRFDERISVGVMYMIKLVHMVDDKLHARATGPYSLVTQQPLGGKAQNGGQRFGEMEVWALEAYGAAHILQEILTIKSDDRVGRKKTYEAIIKQREIPKSGIPEAFLVLQKELQGLAINVKLLDQEGQEIDVSAISKQNEAEERKISKDLRDITSEIVIEDENERE
ncbi:dNA-directed RNA polymerase subunit beta [Coprobacillus sp. CAG:826]|jgi:DNA-directed RNA polymerase subunit beta|nr:dNA-directed RNA polymerase subunit beta [Coprobacillus sp. CAG:826]